MPPVSAEAAPTTAESRPLGELSLAELDEASLAHTDPITLETADECSPELTEIRARLGGGLDETQLAVAGRVSTSVRLVERTDPDFRIVSEVVIQVP
jgi:hypothetical protein